MSGILQGVSFYRPKVVSDGEKPYKIEYCRGRDYLSNTFDIPLQLTLRGFGVGCS
jgi:hypothetical protein